jgi:outer membrane translocation and assembly module TamA
MRGIKAMRYQGNQTLLGEAELDWNFAPRWTLVGFAGAGKAFGDDDQDDSDLIISRGIGIRYLIAAKLGLQMGVDIARGPEDTAFYVQVGSAWAR